MTETREPISLLEAKLARCEVKAREMLHQLEKALVRCGYVRDGIYSSRRAGDVPQSPYSCTILWRNGKILLGRGLQKKHTGKLVRDSAGHPVPEPPVPVGHMQSRDLVRVAHNLSPFVDSLENGVRHQIRDLEEATEIVRAFIERIEADPRPSDEPAQMSEDPGA